MVLAVIIIFILSWYFSMVIQTYAYLKRRGLTFSFLGFLGIPLMLLSMHIKVFRRVSSKRIEVKFLSLFFTNYKISLIFLGELLLENIAMAEAVGYSPHITKKNREVEKISPLNILNDVINLPLTTQLFEETLVDA